MDNYNLQQTDAKIQAILNKVQPVVDNNTVAGFGNGYAISTTTGATADKEVTINGFTPTIGCVFSVMFQNAFSASDPTLNVSNTGAKDLMLFGSALPAAFVPAGTILTLTYDGTNYNVIGRLNDITVKSTLESTDSPLLQDANGNFIKSTPAALASLLGVKSNVNYTQINSSTDLNTLRNGLYFYKVTNPSDPGYPSRVPTPSVTPSDILIEATYIGNITVQVLHFIGESWIRYGYSTTNWSGWIKIAGAS